MNSTESGSESSKKSPAGGEQNLASLDIPSCFLCPQASVKTLIPRDLLDGKVAVFRCSDCGLVFLESRTRDGIPDWEEALYWDDEKQKKIYLEEKVQQTFLREFENRLKVMESLVPKRGDLLDVGCGVGHFLNCAKKRGWTSHGLDISKAASAAAKQVYELEVKVGILSEGPFADQKFDAITLWDVIEHIRTPLSDVKALNRLLKNGGILVMKTPDENSLYKAIARMLFRLFGRKGAFLLKYVYYIPHYFSYSEKSMNRLLKECGFEPLFYERDATPQEFAVEKIHAHYRKDAKRFWVVKALPIVEWLAQILRRQNKMTVYARKVHDL